MTQLAAVIQIQAGAQIDKNRARAEDLIRHAATRGANLVALPELFLLYGDSQATVASAETIPGPTTAWLAELAKSLQITLIAGSIAERTTAPGKIANTSVVFDETGAIVAVYRKIHLFEINLPDRAIACERDYMVPGSTLTTVTTNVGCLGLAICYDLRFPELFRGMVDLGAEILVIPSAFTRQTGRDHWEVLLRARAIENQAYVIAPNQYGEHTPTAISFGRSMIVDPWGTVLATVPDGEGIALAEIDVRRVVGLRSRAPVVTGRRPISVEARP